MSDYTCPDCNGEFENPAERFQNLICPWCGEEMSASPQELRRGK